MTRLALVDVGNTSTGMALARGRTVIAASHVRGGSARRPETEAALDALARRGNVDGCVLASVVPAANRFWVSALRRRFGCRPLVVDHRLRLGVRIDYPSPDTIGADRLANAAAAVERYGSPVIVADFGTALTFDLVARGDAYVGGIIAPGLPMMTDYMAEKTALLPHVSVKGPHGKVGRSTVGAMRLGAKLGYRGMVREIASYLLEVPGLDRSTLCATGGFARWVLEGMDMPFIVAPRLTFHGLRRIYELNTPR